MNADDIGRPVRADHSPLELAVPMSPKGEQLSGLFISGEPNPPCQICGQARQDSMAFTGKFGTAEKSYDLSFQVCWDCMVQAMVGGAAYARLRGIANHERRIPLREQG